MSAFRHRQIDCRQESFEFSTRRQTEAGDYFATFVGADPGSDTAIKILSFQTFETMTSDIRTLERSDFSALY